MYKRQIPYEDILRTITEFVAFQITQSITKLLNENLVKKGDSMLCSGGGAHHIFLQERIDQGIYHHKIIRAETNDDLINYKELVLMALLAYQRKQGKVNVLEQFTGASKDTISGGIYGK